MMRNRRRHVPALTIALAALIAAGVSSAAAAQDAPAQDAPAPVTTLQGVPQAPIGHRQPRPAELPRDIQRDERDGRTDAQKALDKKLENSICQKC